MAGLTQWASSGRSFSRVLNNTSDVVVVVVVVVVLVKELETV